MMEITLSKFKRETLFIVMFLSILFGTSIFATSSVYAGGITITGPRTNYSVTAGQPANFTVTATMSNAQDTGDTKIIIVKYRNQVEIDREDFHIYDKATSGSKDVTIETSKSDTSYGLWAYFEPWPTVRDSTGHPLLKQATSSGGGGTVITNPPAPGAPKVTGGTLSYDSSSKAVTLSGVVNSNVVRETYRIFYTYDTTSSFPKAGTGEAGYGVSTNLDGTCAVAGWQTIQPTSSTVNLSGTTTINMVGIDLAKNVRVVVKVAGCNTSSTSVQPSNFYVCYTPVLSITGTGVAPAPGAPKVSGGTLNYDSSSKAVTLSGVVNSNVVRETYRIFYTYDTTSSFPKAGTGEAGYGVSTNLDGTCAVAGWQTIQPTSSTVNLSGTTTINMVGIDLAKNVRVVVKVAGCNTSSTSVQPSNFYVCYTPILSITGTGAAPAPGAPKVTGGTLNYDSSSKAVTLSGVVNSNVVRETYRIFYTYDTTSSFPKAGTGEAGYGVSTNLDGTCAVAGWQTIQPTSSTVNLSGTTTINMVGIDLAKNVRVVVKVAGCNTSSINVQPTNYYVWYTPILSIKGTGTAPAPGIAKITEVKGLNGAFPTSIKKGESINIYITGENIVEVPYAVFTSNSYTASNAISGIGYGDDSKVGSSYTKGASKVAPDGQVNSDKQHAAIEITPADYGSAASVIVKIVVRPVKGSVDGANTSYYYSSAIRIDGDGTTTNILPTSDTVELMDLNTRSSSDIRRKDMGEAWITVVVSPGLNQRQRFSMNYQLFFNVGDDWKPFTNVNTLYGQEGYDTSNVQYKYVDGKDVYTFKSDPFVIQYEKIKVAWTYGSYQIVKDRQPLEKVFVINGNTPLFNENTYQGNCIYLDYYGFLHGVGDYKTAFKYVMTDENGFPREDVIQPYSGKVSGGYPEKDEGSATPENFSPYDIIYFYNPSKVLTQEQWDNIREAIPYRISKGQTFMLPVGYNKDDIKKAYSSTTPPDIGPLTPVNPETTVSIPSGWSSLGNGSGVTRYIGVNNVSLMPGASTSGTLKTTISNGQTVTALATGKGDDSKDWALIKWGSQQGFVHNSDLSDTASSGVGVGTDNPSTSKPGFSISDETGWDKVDGNTGSGAPRYVHTATALRDSASETSASLASLSINNIVTVFKKTKSEPYWASVTYNGVQGYVLARCLGTEPENVGGGNPPAVDPPTGGGDDPGTKPELPPTVDSGEKPPAADSGEWVYKTGIRWIVIPSGTNLYNENGQVKTSLFFGDELEIKYVQKNAANPWVEVVTPYDIRGYVRAMDLTDTEPDGKISDIVTSQKHNEINTIMTVKVDTNWKGYINYGILIYKGDGDLKDIDNYNYYAGYTNYNNSNTVQSTTYDFVLNRKEFAGLIFACEAKTKQDYNPSDIQNSIMSSKSIMWCGPYYINGNGKVIAYKNTSTGPLVKGTIDLAQDKDKESFKYFGYWDLDLSLAYNVSNIDEVRLYRIDDKGSDLIKSWKKSFTNGYNLVPPVTYNDKYYAEEPKNGQYVEFSLSIYTGGKIYIYRTDKMKIFKTYNENISGQRLAILNPNLKQFKLIDSTKTYDVGSYIGGGDGYGDDGASGGYSTTGE